MGLIQSVLFDLDGTLLDTAPTLGFALNVVLSEQQRMKLPLEQIRPWVSFGARALVRQGFQIEEDHPKLEVWRQRFLTVYAEHIAQDTQLFPGMADVLNTLEKRGIPWGIVTNKPAYLTQPLLENLGLNVRSHCLVSGDTLPYSKPHPAPLLQACQWLNCSPQNSVYIGDALRDIEAGQRAGMSTVVALYGYLSATDKPWEWGASAMVEQPLALLNWMDSVNG